MFHPGKMKAETLSELSQAVGVLAPETVFDWPPARRRAVCGVRRVTAIDASQIENGAALIRELPRPDEILFAVMARDFSMAALLPVFLRLAKARAQWAVILTLGWNAGTTSMLAGLLREKQIGAADVIASSYFVNADKAEYERGKAELEQAGARVASGRCHVKALMLDFGDRQILATGSANFRSAVCLESLVITTAPEPFALFRSVAADIFKNPQSYA